MMVCPSISLSQNPEWMVYRVATTGLPDNNVYSVAVEDNGAKWIGTYNGLARFDGDKWTAYHSSNSSLPDAFITYIEIDKSGKKCRHYDGR